MQVASSPFSLLTCHISLNLALLLTSLISFTVRLAITTTRKIESKMDMSSFEYNQKLIIATPERITTTGLRMCEDKTTFFHGQLLDMWLNSRELIQIAHQVKSILDSYTTKLLLLLLKLLDAGFNRHLLMAMFGIMYAHVPVINSWDCSNCQRRIYTQACALVNLACALVKFQVLRMY